MCFRPCADLCYGWFKDEHYISRVKEDKLIIEKAYKRFTYYRKKLTLSLVLKARYSEGWLRAS